MDCMSYEYKGKSYEFILSIKAKIAIEKAQKEKLKNPVVAKIALANQKGFDNLTEEQLTALLPCVNELGDLEPIEIGFIVLSAHPKYRDVNRAFFDELVDDMDMSRGIEETVAFFNKVRDAVFTQMANMQKAQESKNGLKMIASE